MTEQQKTDIYTNFHSKVRGYIISRVNDENLADDLSSDVFLKVYEKLDTYDQTKASISTWIFTITRNTLTDYYRTRRVSDEIPETFADDTSIEEDVCRNEMLELLADALEHLEERERDIVVFHYYSGLTLKDIADRMGYSYAYIKVLHNKALSEMRKYF